MSVALLSFSVLCSNSNLQGPGIHSQKGKQHSVVYHLGMDPGLMFSNSVMSAKCLPCVEL